MGLLQSDKANLNLLEHQCDSSDLVVIYKDYYVIDFFPHLLSIASYADSTHKGPIRFWVLAINYHTLLFISFILFLAFCFVNAFE